VLFINYEYPPIGAGAANACSHFACEFADRGIRTSVLTSAFTSNRAISVEKEVRVYRVFAFRKHAGRSSLFQMLSYLLSAAIHVPSVLKIERPDAVVVFFGFPCGPLGLFIRIFWKTPYVVLLRGGDVPGFESSVSLFHMILTPLRRFIYRNSKGVVANSAGLRHLSALADPGFNYSVIPNGVDTSFFHPLQSISKPGTSFIFIFTGRFCVQKNVGVLLQAFSICYSRNRCIRLILIGEGPLEFALHGQATALAVGDAITWVSWCDKNAIVSYYQSSHCFVNPSINEGMSNSLLEAMACGLPVICGDCPGNREVVIDKLNGFLFNSSDSIKLADLMRELVDNSYSAAVMGNRGRELCRNRFSWSVSATRLLELLTI
jgi:glycosyltransferase involved in cell wall biosynthesis